MADYGDRFEGIEGPTDAELTALESEDFSAETVKSLQKMYRKIDPGYDRLLSTRERRQAMGVGRIAGPRGGMESAATQDELIPGQGGTLHDVSVTSSDYDPADSIRSISGAPMSGDRSPYFEEHKNSPAYLVGLHYLKTAGACNHPRCQQLRARGMELIGGKERYGVGKTWEATQPAIPSVREDKPYRTPSGQMGVEVSYRPADPSHPAWRQALANRRPGDLLDPSDLLEHHHGPEEEDFAKNPLPFL